MEALFDSSPFSGYVYPNETLIPWTLLIVVYPYLTGLVAGAFTISSLYQVFGFHQLRPVAISLCSFHCVAWWLFRCPCSCTSGIRSEPSMP